jgi:glucose/mannose-6-phosphate isomerase
MLLIKEIDSIDSKKMHQIYDEWPLIAKSSFSKNFDDMNLEKPNHIIFAGMGGSGIVGDMFASILSLEKIHVEVVKGYKLPNTVTPESLVITISSSGNTEETLSILTQTRERNCKTISFANGGRIQDYCKLHNLNFIKVDFFHSPRASLTAILYSMLKVLRGIIPFDENEILQSIEDLDKTREIISSNNLTDSNIALNLASWINGIPLIYYPWGLKAAAVRFKNSLQENAKIHAMTENIIETSHNGIISWESKTSVQPIFIIGEDDHDKTRQRWGIFREFFSENHIDKFEIYSIRGTILSKLINLIYVLDYATIYKSVLEKIDPSPIAGIDYIKSHLR